MKRVEGKVAVVTGGAMGMGNGSAKALAKEGAKVAIIDFSDKGQTAAEEINKAGGEAAAYKVDVRDGARLKEIYKEVFEKYGSLDIAVNAAGIGDQCSFFKSDGEF
jgi:NAD(P)-dependent dehydrogenase (short-subunit alcohol dehydrogenase family)